MASRLEDTPSSSQPLTPEERRKTVVAANRAITSLSSLDVGRLTFELMLRYEATVCALEAENAQLRANVEALVSGKVWTTDDSQGRWFASMGQVGTPDCKHFGPASAPEALAAYAASRLTTGGDNAKV